MTGDEIAGNLGTAPQPTFHWSPSAGSVYQINGLGQVLIADTWGIRPALPDGTVRLAVEEVPARADESRAEIKQAARALAAGLRAMRYGRLPTRVDNALYRLEKLLECAA